ALLKLIVAVFLPLVTIVFVVSEHVGLWDRYLGLNHVIEAAGRLETSYAEGIDRILRPGEPAWAPLIKLIHRYSSAGFDHRAGHLRSLSLTRQRACWHIMTLQ